MKNFYTQLLYINMQLQGSLNSFRKGVVLNVFKFLDKDGTGEVPLQDIEAVYSAPAHPDVLSRKKTKEIALSEFLETFELHYTLFVLILLIQNLGTKDAKVTIGEFLDYYTNISATIADDKYFETLMNNVWNLGKVSYGKVKGN